jgi:hypothetical protein
MREMPFREEVYAGGRTEAALLDNLLQVEGIDTLVTADKRFSRIGPHAGSSVYVLDPAHVERARDIADRYRRNEPLKDPRSYRSWRCRACNELIEGQFEVCWKCSRSRPSGSLAGVERSLLDFTDHCPPSPAKPLRDVLVMVVFLLAAMFLMLASSGRRGAGEIPLRALPDTGLR